jgi:YbbR domain-containing protein
VRRALSFVFHNWPLKLAAVFLATLLYAGLVLSQNSQTFPGSVPIEPMNQPVGVVLLSDLGSVQTIRYFAPENLGIKLDSSSFHATVDLTGVDPAAGTVLVAVRVEAIDPRVQILDYAPSQIKVKVDQFISRTVPIQVIQGTVPQGLDVRAPVPAQTTATVSGPATVVRLVVAAQARVQIDQSGINFDRDVELIPVDNIGETLRPLQVVPATVRIQVAVFANRQTRTLPVTPVVTGTPAAGFEVAKVTVTPLVVMVEGDADALAALDAVNTAPVSINGASSAVNASAALALPDGILALGQSTVTVKVTLRSVTATRTFSAGIVLVGARSDRVYTISTDSVLVTIGGSVADLDRLSGSTFTVTADVTGLDTGSRQVTVTANLPAGLTLRSANPAKVVVTAALPAPAPSPSASVGP